MERVFVLGVVVVGRFLRGVRGVRGGDEGEEGRGLDEWVGKVG